MRNDCVEAFKTCCILCIIKVINYFLHEKKTNINLAYLQKNNAKQQKYEFGIKKKPIFQLRNKNRK